uniref:Large ribosomal subunit protein bL21m n=1 Tax=Blastobotrys adeninivorans TaxID=409370 RepID=A0A060T4H4_BLAAD
MFVRRLAMAPVRAPLCSSFARQFSAARTLALNPDHTTPQDPVSFLQRKYNYTEPKDIRPLKEAFALYAKIHIYDRNFLVTEGDTITLPVDLKGVKVGDVLNFDQVSEIGSRDYTLTGNNRISPKVFSIKGRVIEKTRERRSIIEKTQQRQRHVRHVVRKNPMTLIRISELKVNPDY